MTDEVFSAQSPYGYSYIHQRREHGLAVLTLFCAHGSRIEERATAGAVHLTEHLFFRPKNRSVLETLEARGGITDAFTARDYVAYTVQVLPHDLPLAIEAFRHLHLHDSWARIAVAEEKRVVFEEIARAQDSTRTALHIAMYAAAFPEMSLGYPPMGDTESLTQLSEEKLIETRERLMSKSGLCISVVSPHSHAEVQEMLADWGTDLSVPYNAARFAPQERFVYTHRDSAQSACALVYPGIRTAETSVEIALIETILTRGSGARLFKSLRSDRGLVYDVRATHADYRDCGMFDITFGSRPEVVTEVVSRIKESVGDLMTHLVSHNELERGKHVLSSALHLSDVHAAHIAKRAAHDLMFKGRIISTREMLEAIQLVSAETIRSTAARLFSEPGTLVCFGREQPAIH